MDLGRYAYKVVSAIFNSSEFKIFMFQSKISQFFKVKLILPVGYVKKILPEVANMSYPEQSQTQSYKTEDWCRLIFSQG